MNRFAVRQYGITSPLEHSKNPANLRVNEHRSQAKRNHCVSDRLELQRTKLASPFPDIQLNDDAQHRSDRPNFGSLATVLAVVLASVLQATQHQFINGQRESIDRLTEEPLANDFVISLA